MKTFRSESDLFRNKGTALKSGIGTFLESGIDQI